MRPGNGFLNRVSPGLPWQPNPALCIIIRSFLVSGPPRRPGLNGKQEPGYSATCAAPATVSKCGCAPRDPPRVSNHCGVMPWEGERIKTCQPGDRPENRRRGCGRLLSARERCAKRRYPCFPTFSSPDASRYVSASGDVGQSREYTYGQSTPNSIALGWFAVLFALHAGFGATGDRDR